MSKKLNEKHLNEHQCYEIILKLNKTNVLSIKTLAREYNVSEGAIWKVWDNRKAILERYTLLFEKAKERTFRAFVGQFTELEDMLYIWIDNMRCAKLLVPPSFGITKVKSIASSLFILKSNFKASWQWLSQFRACRGLQKMLLHGKGTKVNKNDPELLAALEEFYRIIAQYDPENVYNMDKTSLFFQLLLIYTLLMPNKDISTTKGKKKAKDWVFLIVCTNALECTKFHVHWSGNWKNQLVLRIGNDMFN